MTDIIDNAASENSENEEISKLFPRCKPKISSDINLNKISLTDGDVHQFHYSLESNGNEISSAKTESTINKQTNIKNDLKSNVVENHSIRKSDSMFNIEKSDHDSCEEDHSVVSAYENYGIVQSSHDHVTSPKYDCSSDVLSDELISNCCSNSLNHHEFKLRESRIEIAGGREIFSFSRSRMSKRRYNEDTQNTSYDEKEKRNTSELNEEKLHGHKFRSQRNLAKFLASDLDEKQFKNTSGNNLDESFQQMDWETLEMSQGENTQTKPNVLRQNNSLFVYETHVKGSEVIYDDIGDWEENPSAKENVRLKISPENGNCFQDEVDLMTKPLTASLEAVNSEDGRFASSEELVNSSYGMHEKAGDNIYLMPNKLEMPCDTCSVQNNVSNESSNYEDIETETLLSHLRHVEKSMKLLGNLPIAEYDGSPRRYGPRPGHPERIYTDVPSTCDFSEKLELLHMQSSVPDSKSEDDGPKITPYFSDLHSSNKIQKKDSNPAKTENPYEVNYNNVNNVCEEIQRESTLGEFYQNNSQIPNGDNKEFKDLEYKLYRVNTNNSYIGRRLAQFYSPCLEESPKKLFAEKYSNENLTHQYATNCNPGLDSTNKLHMFDGNAPDFMNNPKDIFLLRQPEEPILVDGFDQDCETISTNPDTEDLAETEMGEQVGHSRNFTLSPETTDCDSNDVESEVSFENEDSLNSSGRAYGSMPVLEDGLSSGHASDAEDDLENDSSPDRRRHHSADNPTTILIKKQISEIEKEIARCSQKNKLPLSVEMDEIHCQNDALRTCLCSDDADLDYLDPLRQATPPPPAPHPYRKNDESYCSQKESVDEAIKEIKQAIQKTKAMTMKSQHVEKPTEENDKPVWIPRPLFGQQQLTGDGNKPTDKEKGHEDGHEDECDTDQETDRLLGKQRSDDKGFFEDRDKDHKKKGRSKEVLIHEPAVLIEGVLFRARYLGSTQLVCEGQPTKATRMMQAEEAVSRIKAPEGENQPSTEVDLFISTEKIMVLNTDLKEIMMDHSLRTISYIADIGDLVVLMARRRMMNCQEDQEPKIRRTPKMICHVFESEEAQFIAQSIGQAFQVAYMEFLKANGIEDHSFVKEMDYQEVLNSQEIYGDELEMFAKKEMQKEVVVPKGRGEILGVVIVESGWGSMLPTVVIANLSPSGAAARCGQLNIGDQIIAINGISLVGLPLSTCQTYIKNAKNQMVVKLTVVPCAPVVEVKIKRPDTKYQLGFSVQNGVICSLLRGGIAERGGVRVGHRIIEINSQSVVAVPHERIVNLLATSVGEILMKTMPTSMFRLLTGQETPVYI